MYITEWKGEREQRWNENPQNLISARVETLPTSADGFSFVEEIKDVPTPLMVQSENWPEGLHLSLSLVRLCFSCDREENAES